MLHIARRFLPLVSLIGGVLFGLSNPAEAQKPAPTHYNEAMDYSDKHASDKHARELLALTRDRYWEMVRISRLPAAEQQKKVAYLYFQVENDLESVRQRYRMMSRLYRVYPGVIGTAYALPPHPEALLKQIEKKPVQAAYPDLYEVAAIFRQNLLYKQREAVLPLVRQDLRSGDSQAEERGLRLAAVFPMPALFDEIVSLYLRPVPPDSTKMERFAVQSDARDAMRLLSEPQADPRTLKRLLPYLNNTAFLPSDYFEMLRHCLRNQPSAPPQLLAALNSPDAHLRASVLRALGECNDPKLIPHLRRLMHDVNPDVRLAAGFAALGVLGENGKQLRAEVRKLLHDRDRSVRRDIAEALNDAQKVSVYR